LCGICGIAYFNKEPVEKNSLQLMMDRMRHPGPDDEGIFIDENIGLGFVRLSIIDLSIAGQQPMYSRDRRHVIIYNG
jgi:asparagine synthase (glutamine-hydrolysing)